MCCGEIIRFFYSSSGLSSQPVSNMAVLEIARFSSQDEGLYICEARNDAGVSTKRIQLVVDSKPNRGDITGKFF